MHENFQKSELDKSVFGRISKTVNLLRTFTNFQITKYFAKWAYETDKSAEKQQLFKNQNYKIVKLLNLWNLNEKSTKTEENAEKKGKFYL